MCSQQLGVSNELAEAACFPQAAVPWQHRSWGLRHHGIIFSKASISLYIQAVLGSSGWNRWSVVETKSWSSSVNMETKSCGIHVVWRTLALESKGYRFRSWPLLSSNVTLGKSVSSVTQSCPILWPHGLQHTRLPCPSPTPEACSDSCPLSWWCHPTISSSVVPFSSCPQSFPASGSFPMSQFFASGGQSIGISASASVLPMNIQDWFPFG